MHEQSETIQDPVTGKWVNVYGKGTKQSGQRLPDSGEYNSVNEAVSAAQQRSSNHMEETVNIRMPDGTLFKDVPVNAPRDEVRKRYEALTGKKLEPDAPERHMGQRALDSVVGGLEKAVSNLPDIPVGGVASRPQMDAALGYGETSLHLASQAPGMIAGGLAGAVASIGDTERGARVLGQVQEFLSPMVYEPRSSVGKRGAENFMEGNEALRSGSGKLGEIITGGPKGQTAGEFTYDFITNVLPAISGARMYSNKVKTDKAKLEAEKAEFAANKAKLDRQLELSKPLDFNPPITEMPGGLELNQRGAPPAVWDKNPDGTPKTVKIADMPLEDMLVPKDQYAVQRGGLDQSINYGTPYTPSKRVTPDPLDLHIDPITRITAVEHLDNPTMRKAAKDLEAVETALELRRREFNDPVLQRGVDMSESLGLNKAKRLNDEITRLEQKRWELMEVIENGSRKAIETAQKHPLKIEPTHDGRRMVHLPKRMGGQIDADLLTFGIPALIQKIGETGTFKKFAGIFKQEELSKLAYQHNQKGSHYKAVWMSPDDFHLFAMDREPALYGKNLEEVAVNDPRHWSEAQREAIRPVIKSPASKGLNEIPDLKVSFQRIRATDGALVLKVTGHEGRHRNDVFREVGLEQTPVRLVFTTRDAQDRIRGFKGKDLVEKAIEQGQKVILESENGFHERPFPGFANLDPYPFTSEAPVRKSQAGAADVDLLTSIATLGVSKLVKKGIERFHKEPKSKAPTEKSVTAKDSHSIVEVAAGETRPPDEWKKTLTPEQKTQDIPDGLATAGLTALGNASFLNHFTGHPGVKYVLDRVGNFMRTNSLAAMMVKEGAVFGLKGLLSKTVDPKSPKGLWSALSRKEQEMLSMIANEYGGRYELSRAELKTLGASEKVADAYRAFVDAFNKALDDVNSVRKADEQINKLPGYFTKLREGDFKLSVKDKNGDTVYSNLYWNKIRRGFVERKLKERFGDEYTIELSEIDRNTRGNPYNTATVPFEELMDMIGKGDARYRAIDSVVREVKGKRGFGRHNIHRRNIEGGEINPSNFYKAFENYIDSAYRYKSNMEMKKLAGEFQFDTDLKMKNFKNWTQDYTDLAAGNFKPGWLVDNTYKLAELITRGVTFNQTGASMPAKVLEGLNSWFMYKALFSYRPAFLAAQGVQPFAFAPQWIAHYQAKGFDGPGATVSFYKGEKLLLENIAAARGFGKGDPDFREFINHLVSRGGIDPNMVHAMDLFGTKTDTWRTIGRWATGYAPAQLLESAGRLQTSAVGYAFFKDAGLKGKELWSHTERFVNDVMVDYTKQEQPSWVGRTGIFGKAAGPLSTFFTNFAGSTALFLKDIADNPGNLKAWKPMAIHTAQTAIWAGLTGIIGAKIIDKLIDGLKALGLLEPKTPNFTELVMTGQISDTMAFGVASGMTGMNFGASMAAPDVHLVSANTFPGVKMLGEIMENLWPILNPMKTSTQAQRLQAFKTIAPNYLGSIMDVYDIRVGTAGVDIRKRAPGEVVPNTSKRGFGGTALDEHGQRARMLGTRSLDDVREMEGVRRTQEVTELSNANKTQIIDLATDRIMYGESQHSMADLVKKASEYGMMPQQFMAAVKENLMNRKVEAERRAVGKRGPRSPAAMDKHRMIEEYKNQGGYKPMSDRNESEKIKEALHELKREQTLGRGPVDDGASASKDSTSKRVKQQVENVTQTQIREWIGVAKRLFPNNSEKQIKYVEMLMARYKLETDDLEEKANWHRKKKTPNERWM